MRSIHARVQVAAARADLAPSHRVPVPESRNGWCGQCSASRVLAISSSPSGAPWAFSVPCRFGAPKPITVRQAISDGRSLCRACSIAAAIASGSWPSIRHADHPDALKRASWSSEQDSDVAPSIEIRLSSNSTISRLSPQMPGQRNRFVAEALHQAAVAGDDIGIVIDEIVAEARVQQALRQRHADRRGDALPERPGRGLDTRRMAVFGVARRFRSPLPERLEFVRPSRPRSRSGAAARRAASSRGRPTARSGRGPATPDRPHRISGSAKTARWRHRPCPSACPDGRTWPSRRRRWPGSGWRWPFRRAMTSGRLARQDRAWSGHTVRLLRSISCRISGVRMSCIARSSFDP